MYLTFGFFLSNDLISYASACAFGFLLSFAPLALMIVVVLVRIMHASPSLLTSFLDQVPLLKSIQNAESSLDKLFDVNRVSFFEFAIVIAIILMARRFFASIIGSLRKIFGQEQDTRPVINQFFILAGEALIVLLLASITFLVITARTITDIPGVHSFLFSHSKFWAFIIDLTLQNLPYIILFIMTVLAYRAGSRTRPSLLITTIMAASSTFILSIVLNVMQEFINFNAYNVIYGVLGNAIVLLLSVFLFFMIFLFFAQWLFVYQFFDTLLLCELYILPDHTETGIFATIKRALFIRPDHLMIKNGNLAFFKQGEHIYSINEEGHDAYYLVRGTVKLQTKNHISFIERGKFFGEEACMLNGIRTDEAIACTDADVIRIPEETFFSLLERNPKVSRKALSLISNYFSKFYGLSRDL
ncbi:YhjD/YihY/BrkB family envelope integrity protein [Treponema sp.]|uniref:YhjD/YihY/BrkB family envelope integrity protein n=1 Tax=Treponema sp. TaxID=166 RepID=UPI0025E2A68A|nr:YhjD/YihY/BrkB family envelope integrity protein [Treponema sp.]MCR5218208.1 YihY/virulence factor BrkB family protein [Treponema sp.]